MDIQTVLSSLIPYLTLLVPFIPVIEGLILPPFVNIINKDINNTKNKFWMVFVFCIVVAVLDNVVRVVSELSAATSVVDIFATFSFIFLSSQVSYYAWFKDSVGRVKQEAGELNTKEAIAE